MTGLLKQIVIFTLSLPVMAFGIWLMLQYMIAEGAITLAAFPVAFAIAGTVYFGVAAALGWGVTVYLTFHYLFEMTPGFAAAYAVLYFSAVLLAALLLRRFGFRNLLQTPVRSLVLWYLIVGLAFPVLTSAIGVPLLAAGGGTIDSAQFVLLFTANFISDSFSPVSLGLALCAVLAWVIEKPESVREAGKWHRLEQGLWLALCALAIFAVVGFGEVWASNGILEMAPAFFLLLVWAALRFSMVFALVAAAAVGLVVTSCYAFGLGGSPVPETTRDAIDVYSNLLAMTVLAQVSSAMTLQRARDHQRAMRAELDRANLKRYFSPRLVEDLLSRSESVDHTRSQRVVVMFVDIVGFTSIAEQQTPEETIAMLREFDTEMEEEIFRNSGVVDKYIGDGVMAAFGLPQVGKADVASAVRCARAMVERTAKLAERRKRRGKTPFSIGVGLHVGHVVAGNVGSERNLSFTVIGDAVNTASRLESLSRSLKASIVVSEIVIEAVRHEAPDEHASLLDGFEKIGETTVKGRADPVNVWILPLEKQ